PAGAAGAGGGVHAGGGGAAVVADAAVPAPGVRGVPVLRPGPGAAPRRPRPKGVGRGGCSRAPRGGAPLPVGSLTPPPPRRRAAAAGRSVVLRPAARPRAGRLEQFQALADAAEDRLLGRLPGLLAQVPAERELERAVAVLVAVEAERRRAELRLAAHTHPVRG